LAEGNDHEFFEIQFTNCELIYKFLADIHAIIPDDKIKLWDYDHNSKFVDLLYRILNLVYTSPNKTETLHQGFKGWVKRTGIMIDA
jgi:hypothetical protein